MKTKLRKGKAQRRFGRRYLTSASNESSACGVGFICNLKGVAKNRFLLMLLRAGRCMNHRGGCGSDGSGDGYGISTTLPYLMFEKWLSSNGTAVDDMQRIGVAQCYMSHDQSNRGRVLSIFDDELRREFGSDVICRERVVPIRKEVLPKRSAEAAPFFMQIVIVRPAGFEGDYDRALYRVRNRVEDRVQQTDDYLYVDSMSGTQINYGGMLAANQLAEFYMDLQDGDYHIIAGMVHRRFSTGTLPNWERGQPFRMIAHNGEVVTVTGNKNHVRSWVLASPELSDQFGQRVINPSGSDSAMLDNTVEAMYYELGLPLEYSLAACIPRSYKDQRISVAARHMLLNNAARMKAWFGPTHVTGMERGKRVVACLGRSNLRPSRFQKLKPHPDGDEELICVASDLGAFGIKQKHVEIQEPLGTSGGIVVADAETGTWSYGAAVLDDLASKFPFEALNKNMLRLPKLEMQTQGHSESSLFNAALHNWHHHDYYTILSAMLRTGKSKNRAMGYNVPPYFLSKRGQPFEYAFKQGFNGITAPPFDSIRERGSCNLEVFLGPLDSPFVRPELTRGKLLLRSGLVTPREYNWISETQDALKVARIDCTYCIDDGPDALEQRIGEIEKEAEALVRDGAEILVISDENTSYNRVPVPMLAAVGATHQHLMKTKLRPQVGILAHAGVVRDEDLLTKLFAIGANAVNPYLLYEMGEHYHSSTSDNKVTTMSVADVHDRITKSLEKGILSIIGKVGNSSLWEYQASFQFEIYGLSKEVVRRIASEDTPSFFHAHGFRQVQMVCDKIHRRARKVQTTGVLPDDGIYAANPLEGEPTSYGKTVLAWAQQAAGVDLPASDMTLRWDDFDRYLEAVGNCGFVYPRRAFKVKPLGEPIPLEKVESAQSLAKRFFSGDMSFGALTPFVKRDIAVALNRLGMIPLSGEGGAPPELLSTWPNGDRPYDRGRQSASGKFDFTPWYYTPAEYVVYKAQQGAKPGMGGMFPASKNIPFFARLRRSRAFKELYSSPEQKDTFSIEDYYGVMSEFAVLNPRAMRVTKFCAKLGIEVVACGAAKSRSGAFLIADGTGGTGASTWEALKASGGHSEIALKACLEALCHDDLAQSTELWTDGGIRDIHDVITLGCLGASRFGFGTLLMVLLTCVKANTCNTLCPVDVTTLAPDGQLRYRGNPENIIRFFTMFLERLREWMAANGVERFEQIVGRSELLEWDSSDEFLAEMQGRLQEDIHALTAEVEVPEEARLFTGKIQREEELCNTRIDGEILTAAEEVISGRRDSVRLGPYEISNEDRVIGGHIAGEMSRRNGHKPFEIAEDAIRVRFKSNGAGNSFGFMLPKGFTFTLEGCANDGVGKGLAGGRLVVVPANDVGYRSDYMPLVGDIPLLGATSGELLVPGCLGNRAVTCLRGARAVAHGCGDHGFNFVTSGEFVCLGPVGDNFGAGTSGGRAFVLDQNHKLANSGFVNTETVLIREVQSDEEQAHLLEVLTRFHKWTDSRIAAALLEHPERIGEQFSIVDPKDERVVHPITGQVLYDPQQGVLWTEPPALKEYHLPPEERTVGVVNSPLITLQTM
jgi:glutamate synthase domain-containing protein 2/glutamate synthase domain-containing protein 1/glutamate synthase domain-containing protein 3